jgi:hypothetical protein
MVSTGLGIFTVMFFGILIFQSQLDRRGDPCPDDMKGAQNDRGIRINEIESSGGDPGDWLELYNDGPLADLSGWVIKDENESPSYTIPAGTAISPGGFLVFEADVLRFGSADNPRIFNSKGVLVDSFRYSAHALTTYGRCPDGVGDFVETASPTKGSANDCGRSGGPSATPWPGLNDVTDADAAEAFAPNNSDIFYEPGSPNVLWMVRNGPSELSRLVWTGSIWTPELGTGWEIAKTLRFPDGKGIPDAEGVTKAELGSSAIYVSIERDGNVGVSEIPRYSILRFDTSRAGRRLVATHEWNLTALFGAGDANTGLEGITWVPDTFLVKKGFVDETTGLIYDPSAYPNHGTGLFFVAHEADGRIHAMALELGGSSFFRVATLNCPIASVRTVTFDRDVGYLWSMCGSESGGLTWIFSVDEAAGSPTLGRFVLREEYARPTSMANRANEGIAILPESMCGGGYKALFWVDDGAGDGHVLRTDQIPCGAFLP